MIQSEDRREAPIAYRLSSGERSYCRAVEHPRLLSWQTLLAGVIDFADGDAFIEMNGPV
jgi:hypothetical protein